MVGKDRPDMPISRLLPLVLCALVLLAVAPVLTLGYLGARDNTSRLLRDRSELLLDEVEAKIRLLLEPPGRQLTFLGAALQSGRVEPEDTAAFDAFMLGALAATPQVAILALVRPDASVRRYVREGFGVEEWDMQEGYPGIQEALAAAGRVTGLDYGSPDWSPILKQTLLPIRYHLRQADGARATLVAVVTIADLSARLAALGERLEATPFVLLGSDRILAHPRVDLADPTSADRPLPALDGVGDPVLAAIWASEQRPLTSLAPLLRSRGHWTWIGYEPHAYFFRELRGFGDLPWIVGFHTPSTSTRRERWIVLAIGSLGLAMLAASAAASVWIGRRLGRPVLSLAAAAERVEALDFKSVGRIRRSPVREINAAAVAFERMARGLVAFETYVPRTLVRRLVAAGGAAPASESREITVLFTDLEGYTTFSRGRPAEEVVAYLNEVLERVGPLIEAAGGTIDKYTGDGLMAFWGAPEPMIDHARRACEAALAVAAAFAALNEARCWSGKPVCALRVGLHTGPAVVGNIGFPGRLDYTVIGEAVNVAQRIQAAGRAPPFGTPAIVLASEATRAAVGNTSTLRFAPFAAETAPPCELWRLTREETAVGAPRPDRLSSS